ncbi:hypothetical protein PL75_03120 [Neisseria arctica]|uniref:Uncharacterized protein n=1 Tax=Neisseria arctica TaxID=1470200 RepID=A0A0J1C4K4_9NEIS|nr:hypothetical protein [Neisseria arctica]KLT73238.1 hypothetical protein PL75_03120 [Neisseria arctica]UOO87515.1 hypothetical protein LVJ86_04520 [Neisseria arctica]
MAQNNFSIALLAMARGVADAKQAAESAKDVEIAVDEENTLKANGKDTGIKIITENGVAKAVGAALSSSDTASKLAEEQAAFRQSQISANIQIALEKGVFYIEDGLTSDLRGKALSGWWKTNKQTPEEAALVSAQIQDYINRLPSGVVVKARHGSVFSIDKNVGALPEKFGTDGRRITVGGMTLTIDGAQPCIYIDKDSGDGRVYDFRGAEFIVESLGVNAFEYTGDNNVILNGGIMRTRALLEFGYVRGADKDKMLFAPIDGWTKERPDIGFGYADKGLWELGFNTTTLRHDLARYRNNAAQVHEVRQPDGMNKARCAELTRQESSRKYDSVGGYWDENGESAFPQDDGTTSPMWGKWRGGQRGSRGNGITLYNCHNTTIFDFDIEGFDGSAVQMGLYATQDCQDVAGGDTATAEAKGMIAYDTLICGGWFDKMYTGGVGAVRAVGLTVTGLQCQGNKVGHPDWSVEHSRDGKMVTIDPGYMLWTSRYMPMVSVVFTNNHFGTAARKVIDAHTGNDITITGNSGSAGYYGISVVIEETFASQRDAGAPAETSSFYYQESNMTIANNNVMGGVYGVHLNNGATGIKARKDRGLWWLRGNIKVRDNIIKSAYVGVCYNYGHYGFDITGNSVTFANKLGEPYGQRRLNTINVTDGGSGYSAGTYLTISGGGELARDGYAEPVIKDGVITSVVVRKTGTRYEDAASIVVTAVDPTGAGSGATFSATISETSYAYMIGAEPRYGAMQVNFTGNRAANSPDGNFGRLLVSGTCIGSTFRDNLFNETPYTKGDDASKPYISAKDYVHRSGLPSQLLAQTQDHVDSHHENNKAINELSGKVTDLLFKNKYVTTKAPEVPLTSSEIETLVNNRVAAILAEKNVQASEPAASPESQAGTQSQPEATNEEPTSGLPKILSFNMATATGSLVRDDSNAVTVEVGGSYPPPGWSDVADVSGENKFIMARLKDKVSASAGVYPRFKVDLSAETESTIVLPIKVHSLGTRAGVVSIGLTPYVSDDISTSLLIDKKTETNQIAIRNMSRYSVSIDGVANTADTRLDYDKWYILVLKSKLGGEYINLGTNHTGNGQIDADFGAGLTVYRNHTPSAEDLNSLVESLKVKYHK